MDNSPRSARSIATPMLLFSCFCLLVGDVLFGYDTSSFGGILANPSSFQPYGLVLLPDIRDVHAGRARPERPKSPTEKNTVVAAFMLFGLFYNIGGGPVPYLLGAGIPNAAVREKTQAIGTSWNVIWVFVTNFAIPYMINGIHFKVVWVFGSLSLLDLLFTFFFLPETKCGALEEIDAVFSVPFNPFRLINNHVSEAAWRSHSIEGKPADVSEHVGNEPQKGFA